MDVNFVDYYSLFSIKLTATIDEISKAYKRLALIYHPDKYKDSSIFLVLQKGYQTLTQDRDAYDIKYAKFKKKSLERVQLDKDMIEFQTHLELQEINQNRQKWNLEALEQRVFKEIDDLLKSV